MHGRAWEPWLTAQALGWAALHSQTSKYRQIQQHQGEAGGEETGYNGHNGNCQGRYSWEDYLEERIDKEEHASPTSRSQDQNLFLPTNNY